MTEAYKICTRCVMDTSDPIIKFDSEGVCTHCHQFDEVTKKNWFPNDEGANRLEIILNRIKSEGRNSEYDCIIGLSGGVDSSYLALKVKQWGLRPLVVHVDAGWNSELAVANIEKIVKYCGFDLHTHVMNWEEMRELQLAYLRSGISNQDVPQDHAFFASMYHFAMKNNIKYIFSGGNIATESVTPQSWHGSAMDAINLQAIHRRYGKRPLTTYKTISFFQYYIYYPIVKGMRTILPLNYLPYDKEIAISELQETIGWRAYGRKHGESLFTKLFQNYVLPRRFGYDKRRPHFSSLVLSGQMSRSSAQEKLSEPLYDPHELEIDIDYMCKKLRISRPEFEELMLVKPHLYSDFNNWGRRYELLKNIQSLAQKITGKKFKVYS